MRDPLNKLLGLTLPPSMEKEYIEQTILQIETFIKLGLIALLVGTWIYLGLLYDPKTFTNLRILTFHIILMHIIIGIGFVTTFAPPDRRIAFTKYVPVIASLFIFNHVEVAYICWKSDLSVLVHGFVMVVIFLNYGIERISMSSAVATGVLISIAYVIQLYRVGDISSFTPIIAHCFFTNLIGFIVCYSSIKAAQGQTKLRSQLGVEKNRTENLLHNILPVRIANDLLNQQRVIAKNHDSVSVLFADLANFTATSETLPASQIVAYLNEMFTTIDAAAGRLNVEKIKTIGDGYMAVCGCPEEVEDHADRLATFALEITKIIETFNFKHKTEFGVRIGLHSGPVVAGVICEKRFCYDIWGDTVNTASRIESHSKINCILVSEDFAQQLGTQSFNLSKSHSIKPKGKSEFSVRYLIDKNDMNEVTKIAV